MHEDLPGLDDLFQQRYGIAAPKFEILGKQECMQTVLVTDAQGSRWIARVAEAADPDDRLTPLATILTLLAAHDFPAERMLPALDGAAVAAADQWRVLTTHFVVGQALEPTPPDLFALGSAVGQLHALAGRIPLHGLPLAEMRPAPEVAWATGKLTSVADQVPRAWRGRYEELLHALQTLDILDDLPPILIHNDCHPANGIRQAHREVALIDWVGAGLGAAIIDVGFLLANCVSAAPWSPPLPPEPQRVVALMKGYGQHHRLTAHELDRLPDAIRFRALVYGAVTFAAAVFGRETVDLSGVAQGFWTRYTQAEKVAAQACAIMSV